MQTQALEREGTRSLRPVRSGVNPSRCLEHSRSPVPCHLSPPIRAESPSLLLSLLVPIAVVAGHCGPAAHIAVIAYAHIAVIAHQTNAFP
eukprot:1950766-Rhodomonas_salina.1